MTNDEIDRAVAEKVMGWTLGEPEVIHGEHFHGYVTVRIWQGSRRTDPDGTTWMRSLDKFHPSTDIHAAFEVVQKLLMIGKTVDLLVHAEGAPGFFCGDPLPLLICKAALAAVGVAEPTEPPKNSE